MFDFTFKQRNTFFNWYKYKNSTSTFMDFYGFYKISRNLFSKNEIIKVENLN